MFGGNASAEGGDDDGGGAEAATVTGVDIVRASQLVGTSFAKKDYQVYIKVRLIMEYLSTRMWLVRETLCTIFAYGWDEY